MNIKENVQVQGLEALPEQILTFEQATKFLKISASTLYKLTHKKAIKHYKPNGKLIYFKVDELLLWMTSNEQKSGEGFMDELINNLTQNNGKKR